MTRSRLPIWLMGFCNLPVGIGGAVGLVTTPQILAAQHTPEPMIANVTATMLVSVFTAFLFAPALDWRLSRKTYAIILAVLSGLLAFVALLDTHDLVIFAVLLLAMGLANNLNNAAVGGWLSGLTTEEEKDRLGAWMTIANVVGVGATSAVAIFLLRHLPPVVGPAAIGLLLLIPIPIYLALPATPADPALGHESFARFARDVTSLFRQARVRWLIFFLILPAANFALSNTLPSLGADYGASEAFVGVVCGAGVAVAGVLGGLVVPPLAVRWPAEKLFPIVGVVGAVFSLSLILAPRTPIWFAIADFGQNGLWTASYSLIAVIALRANGENNPLAATQFALLSAASGVPLTYMQIIDGHAYGAGGLAASYVADAGLSLLACAALAMLLAARKIQVSPAGPDLALQPA
jgi:MFS transporter, PAT family, beta-lactamase induction signal transducer AmpG